MTVYVAWTPELPEHNLPGPWTEIRAAAPGLLLVESSDTLSRVFHELKWALAEEAPLSWPHWPRPPSCAAWSPAP